MKRSNLTRLFSTAAILGAISAPALSVQAQEDGITLPGASAEVTLDYVSQYFFRGFEQLDSDQGVVLQPGASLSLPIASSDNLDVAATVGTWGSIHTDTPGAGSQPSSWYEQDVYAGLTFTSGIFEVYTGYTYYTYPSNVANADIHEINLIFSMDDSEWFGEYAFSPYIEIAFETQNNVDTTGENAYLGLGGEFAFDMSEVYDAPITWTVPFVVGLSLDDYYTDASGAEEFFGFASVGLQASIPMSELIGSDEWFGAWDLTGGVTFYFLNSDVALTDNADDTSDNFQVVANLGISREW